MNFKSITNKKIFIFFLLIPLSLGLLSFLLTKDGIASVKLLNKPSFYPPNFLFSLAWTIFYILMGVSSYFVYQTMSFHKTTCLAIYALNLFLLFLWPLIFFNLQARLFAFIFIIFLDLVVFYMILCFLGISKKAAYLQIPYFLWLIYASVLNFSIYFLNR